MRIGRPPRHGMSSSREYSSWRAMRKRCNYQGHTFYSRYGGRGIKICKRWNRFELFYTDMGQRPIGTSLDRIDNDKGYSPSNCRWATKLQQGGNKSNTIFIKHNKTWMTLIDAARATGISIINLYARKKIGWPDSRMLEPVRAYGLKARQSRPNDPSQPVK